MSKNQKDIPSEMGFLDHLEVLRWHLIRSSIAIVVLAVVAFFYHDFIFNTIILAPKNPDFITNELFCRLSKFLDMDSLCINSKPFQIININMAGQFSTHMTVSAVAGIIVAFPYIFWEIWRFIKPALHKNEKTYTKGAVFFTSLLFMIGIVFGFYVIVPLSVHFLGNYSVSNQIVNQINLGSYISTVTSVTLASGIVFELPIVVFLLSKIGLITPKFLRHNRKYAIVVILIIAAIITPPDVFSQLLVSVPLLFLYEISIFISKKVTSKDAILSE
jgi:sec-independent protein translocase protein TatC